MTTTIRSTIGQSLEAQTLESQYIRVGLYLAVSTLDPADYTLSFFRSLYFPYRQAWKKREWKPHDGKLINWHLTHRNVQQNFNSAQEKQQQAFYNAKCPSICFHCCFLKLFISLVLNCSQKRRYRFSYVFFTLICYLNYFIVVDISGARWWRCSRCSACTR